VLNVRERGLVIISGCSHAGVINVLFHAQRLTGEARIAGLLGGLHLTGGLFEARIEPTVQALRAARVGRVLPAHCSGWRAVHAIARAMPEAFVQSAVGTTVTFEAAPANSS
jgi:7,8-dihydropterin-6-yl-methyl-4-(beta-D-ribofuranosyl)aminobenzene 5'-phosphate synthase